MNTKIKKSIVGLMCIIGGAFSLYMIEKDSEVSFNGYLHLDNVEALASNEGWINDCVGIGSVDCNGRKVKSKSSIFSIPLLYK